MITQKRPAIRTYTTIVAVVVHTQTKRMTLLGARAASGFKRSMPSSRQARRCKISRKAKSPMITRSEWQDLNLRPLRPAAAVRPWRAKRASLDPPRAVPASGRPSDRGQL